MQPGFSAITTSRYYHPAFNSAIFDGPIRIYFVQFHESYALKIYFLIQERFKDQLLNYKEIAKKIDKTLVVMIYPTEDSFIKAFSKVDVEVNSKRVLPSVAKAIEPHETILGMLAPIDDYNVGQLMDELSDIFKKWEKSELAPVFHANCLTPMQDVI